MKKNFFETKIYKILEKVGNLIALNFVFVITCIPIITIGVSMTALYSSLHSDMSYKSYFSAYGKNWKQSTIVWLLIVVFIDVAVLNGYLIISSQGNQSVLVIVSIAFSLFFVGMFFSWVFELISLFDNKLKNVIKNSAILGFGNLPITVVAICLNLIFPVVLFCFTDKILQYGWIWLGFGFSAVAFLSDKMLMRAITKSTGIVFVSEEQNNED